MNGSIVVLVASDPIEVHIQNVISGTSPIGLVVISAADPPGGSGYETLNEGVNYSFVEVSLFVQAQLTALAMLNGTTAYYDDTGVNEFYLFCSDLGGQIVIIAVVIVSNTVAIVFVVYAYIVKFMNVACAKLVKYIIVGMVFELIGALFRVIANIDPAGCLRVLPTSYGNIFVIAGAAFTLIDCLLMALYLHETRTLKKMKVNTWITTKTQWVFYVICAIMFAISVITALARLTEAFDMINVIAILVLAVINICIGIFFGITSFKLLNTITKYESLDPAYVKKLAARLFVTCFFFLFWIAIILIAATPFSNHPYTHALLSMAIKTSFAVICIINMLSLINAKKRASSSTKTSKTKTSKTSDGSKSKSQGTNRGEDKEDSNEESKPEESKPESSKPEDSKQEDSKQDSSKPEDLS